ncbi:MAG TPA: TolC family protein [Acidobacteriota bacterium]|nr:TolC family protein [Acidobacteriota bacterium]
MAESQLLQELGQDELEGARKLSGDESKLVQTLEQGLSLEELLALAALRNPSVKATGENVKAALEGLDQAAYLQELLVRYRAFTRELDTVAGMPMQRPDMKRFFPAPAALTLKSVIAQARIEMARLDFQAALRQAVNSMARAYFELQYIDNAIEVLLESRDLFRRMEQVALAQLRVGKASQADALRSQALLDILDADLENLREQRLSALARANALLDLPVETAWRRPASRDLADPEMDLDQARRLLQRHSQRLHNQQQLVRMREAALRLAELTLYPLPATGASRLDLGRGAEAGPLRSTAATFSNRPMLGQRAASFATQSAYLEELRHRLEADKETLQGLEASLEADAGEALRETSQARRSHRTYAELVVPKSLRAFNSMRGRYNTASAAFIEYLDAGRAYLEASLQSEKARRDHNEALTRLLDVLGLGATRLLKEGVAGPQPQPGQAHR